MTSRVMVTTQNVCVSESVHIRTAARRERFAALQAAGFNEIVEILQGAPHARPWGDYMQWIMTVLLNVFMPDRHKRRRHPKWSLTLRPEIHVGDHVVVPDFAGWHDRRVRSTQRRPFCKFSSDRYVHAPDWTFDVLEPTHAEYIRTQKAPVYLELGVSYMWLLDPVLHRLESYTTSPDGWQLTAAFEGRGAVHAAPLEHLEIDLGQLWPNPNELAAAEHAALTSVSERLDECLAAGAADHSLLRMLMAAGLLEEDTSSLEQSDNALLRALALVSCRVAIADALQLARLEIAAEKEARRTTTRSEARAMADELLAADIQQSLDEIAAGLGISAEESLRDLSRRRKRKPRQPLRDHIELVSAQFAKSGTLTGELERQALHGPNTAFIPFEHWPAIANEAIKRLALPYHDEELAKRISVLRQLYDD